MKYHAPILNYIPKASFQDRDFCPIVYTSGTLSYHSATINAASETVYFNNVIRSNLWTLQSIWISVIPLATANPMYCGILVRYGTEGESWNNYNSGTINHPVPNCTINLLKFIDITSLITLPSQYDNVNVAISYSATATATNMAVKGCWFIYSLT